MKTIKTSQMQAPQGGQAPQATGQTPAAKMSYNALVQQHPQLKNWVDWFNGIHNTLNKQKPAFKQYLQSIGVDGTQVPELASIVMD